MILSQVLWRDRFGSAPQVLRAFAEHVDEKPHVIVGIAKSPVSIFPDARVSLLIPYALDGMDASARTIAFTAPRKSLEEFGATLDEAEAEGHLHSTKHDTAPRSVQFFFRKDSPVIIHHASID